MPYEYKVMGKPVKLEVDPSCVAVRFREPAPNSVRAAATESAGVGPFSTRFEIPGEKLTIVPTGAASGGPGPAAAVASLNSQPDVEQALPVFRMGANQVVAPDRVIIGLRDVAAKNTIIAKYKLVLLRERENEILCGTPEGTNVFDLCAQLDKEEAVAFAEPDFVTIGQHMPRSTAPESHPLLSNPPTSGQYAMQITHATEAWEIQRGDPAIRIAILDEGVDTLHPDLAAAVVDRYDAVEDDSYQEPNAWDGHGTACAGLAAGIGENGTVRGSGSGCSLVAVRIARSNTPGGKWVTSSDIMARGIDWSWNQGQASVLSNSWVAPPSNAIAAAFERARTRGRGGLGCVVVAAAGNYSTSVVFPATVDNVLAVSASNEYDEIKTTTSADGETWWGTCFGPEVSVAAPGVHNLTTDIHGSGGYVPGDYYPKFNGTSSATPIVAGACGLVLSANPTLPESDVRDIVRRSTDKVGSIPYVSGRNDYFGYGRLNVLRSVQAALQHEAETASPAPADAQPESSLAPSTPGTGPAA